MYYLQDRAVGEVQLVNNCSHSLKHLERSYILVQELLWKLQPKVPGAQQNLLAYSILPIPVVSIFLPLLCLLGVKQALLHQFLDLLHLLDLLSAISTSLDPIQNIHRHLNWSPIHYMCCR